MEMPPSMSYKESHPLYLLPEGRRGPSLDTPLYNTQTLIIPSTEPEPISIHKPSTEKMNVMQDRHIIQQGNKVSGSENMNYESKTRIK